MIISGTFGNNDIEIHFSFGIGNSINAGVARYRITLDGAELQETRVRVPTFSVGSPGHLMYMGPISAGDHVIKAQWWEDTGTAQNRASGADPVEHRQLLVKEYKS